MSSTSHKIGEYFWIKLEIILNLLKKSEENSYQIQNILKKTKIFTLMPCLTTFGLFNEF